MINPLVSIIIPTYNRAAKIEKAIRSIQAQTWTDWELIVSDDGSKDNTAEVVARFSKEDARIKYIRHDPNKGAQVARNAGIRAAKGEWIAFLDSDDEWLPESLKMRLDFALKHDYSVVYSNGYIIFENNRQELYRLPNVSKNSYKGVLTNEGPMFQSLLVKKENFTRINYLDEQAISYQEWNTSIRLAKFYTFGFLDMPTFIYDYRSPDAISRSYSRNGKAYVDIVRKFFWEMLWNVGTEGLVYHYDRIADWYSQAGEPTKVKYYKRSAFFFKCISVRMMARKLRQMIRSR